MASGWDLTDGREGRAREGGSSIHRGEIRRERDVEGNRRRARDRRAPLRSTAATTFTRAARIGATFAARRAVGRAEGAADARATAAV